MKKIMTSALFLLMIHIGIAQDESVNPEAYALKSTYEQMMQQQGNQLLEEDFIKHFPKDFHSFRRIFHDPDFNGLYLNSSTYLFTLTQLQNVSKEEIGNILLTLCAEFNISNEESAASLQYATHQFLYQNPEVSIQLLNGFTELKLKNVAFLLTNKLDKSDFMYYKKFLELLKREDEALYSILKRK